MKLSTLFVNGSIELQFTISQEKAKVKEERVLQLNLSNEDEIKQKNVDTLSEMRCLLLINFPLFMLPGHLKLNHLICIVLLGIGSSEPTTNGHA